ncbi:MAG: hypothetical protein JSU67_10140 [Gammaproteobacteria bacterium]|nr:MAG: hypothetical protein EP300_12280 [Gammaproteobacteria bacterium]UCH38532.1 MAG: hypothetical protein JSU67_10140 [Gammaproteobacteria bacterium]
MRLALCAFGLLLVCANAMAEFSGNVAAEAQIFPESPQFDDQFDENLTFSFKPKWDGEWNDGDDLWSLELFMRADNKDAGREKVDIREALWLGVRGDNEWRVGINTMFWGVIESKHLVDVINQIDYVEGIDGEEKLGQPMLHLKRYQDWGVLDFLVLPYFRERTFPEKEGRLRLPLVVDTDKAEYESSDEERHVDYALRFSQTYDDLDLGISWFKGTNRDPLFLPGLDGDGEPVLIPFYEQMQQIGVDAQLIYEAWIWRLEAIRREADSNDYNAYTAGFEYTFYGIMESPTDLGLLLEYSYDGRSKDEADVLDDDVFLGTRFAFNDEQSSEILAGFYIDTNNQSRSFRVEANRRFGASWKGTLELQTFADIDSDDRLAAFANDDFLLLEMAYYF